MEFGAAGPLAGRRRRPTPESLPCGLGGWRPGLRHNSVNLCVHLVWRTWDSLPIIEPGCERRLHRAMEAEAQDMGCTVHAIGGTAEHVHLLVSIPPTLAVSDLVKQVKGTTSKFANEVLTPGRFKWQGHYGAYSLSPEDLDVVKEYIRRQKEHHAEGHLIPALEE